MDGVFYEEEQKNSGIYNTFGDVCVHEQLGLRQEATVK